MKTYLVAMSLLTLAVAAVPVASAHHTYCFDNQPLCCTTGDHGQGGVVGVVTTAVADAFLLACEVVDVVLGIGPAAAPECAAPGRC